MNSKSFLTTDATTLRTHQNGAATGIIFLDVEGVALPMEGWDDFVVVILGWWATALLRLLRNESCNVIVNFMDGPYAVEVVKTSTGTLQFRTLEGMLSRIETTRGEAAAVPFIDSLITQSHQILCECKRLGWWSKDADLLVSVLEALEHESIRLGACSN